VIISRNPTPEREGSIIKKIPGKIKSSREGGEITKQKRPDVEPEPDLL
jgi:hypothetical protein